MSFIVISDSYAPLKSASAGMLEILVEELKISNKVFVFSSSIEKSNSNQQIFVNTTLKGWRYKGNIRRLFFEIISAFMISFLIIKNKNKISNVALIIWYCPSSFLWIPVLLSKLMFKSKVYLILRDIFPDWLFHVGALKSRLLYKFLSFITFPQYLVPNVIGCQTIGDVKYLQNKKIKNKFVVLKNWPSVKNYVIDKKYRESSTKIFIQNTINLKKKINSVVLTYLGSTNLAHDLEKIFKMFSKLSNKTQKRIHINFFARNVCLLKKINFVKKYQFNVDIYEQVGADQISTILKYTDFGVVSLSEKHMTNNIPGKFVTYTQFSIPVISFAYKKQDLVVLISKYKCGENFSYEKNEEDIIDRLDSILNLNSTKFNKLKSNAYRLYEENFDFKNTVNKLMKFAEKNKSNNKISN